MNIPPREEIYAALEARHGKELQKKISETSAAVCGLGGLGSNIAVCLARLGIGRLHIIDFDKVDISNINRQQYGIKQIGMYKTEAMKNIISDISPYIEVISDTIGITEENAAALLERDNIICEAFDGAEDKAMLVNFLSERFPEKYIVSASGMAGMGPADDIKTRKISEHLYICGDGKSDVSEKGTLYASRAMICAAHQAHAVLRIISENNL